MGASWIRHGDRRVARHLPVLAAVLAFLAASFPGCSPSDPRLTGSPAEDGGGAETDVAVPEGGGG